MGKILVSGTVGLETTLKVDEFPLVYEPVRYPFFGINSRVAGVGYGVTKALHTLGSNARLLSMVGADTVGGVIRQTLAADGIDASDVVTQLAASGQSVVVYTPDGQRQIHTDLKDMQQQAYPADRFAAALAQCDLAVLTNVNWNRPFLAQVKAVGKPIATDVQTIGSLDDDYNRDYMAAADILFMSDEKLPLSPEAWIGEIWGRWETAVVVIGLGAQGALLGVYADRQIVHVPAVQTRPIVNTVGAGDALFSAFIDGYQRTGDPYQALRQAVVFAGHKIGAATATEGYLTGAELAALVSAIRDQGSGIGG